MHLGIVFFQVYNITHVALKINFKEVSEGYRLQCYISWEAQVEESGKKGIIKGITNYFYYALQFIVLVWLTRCAPSLTWMSRRGIHSHWELLRVFVKSIEKELWMVVLLWIFTFFFLYFQGWAFVLVHSTKIVRLLECVQRKLWCKENNISFCKRLSLNLEAARFSQTSGDKDKQERRSVNPKLKQ